MLSTNFLILCSVLAHVSIGNCDDQIIKNKDVEKDQPQFATTIKCKTFGKYLIRTESDPERNGDIITAFISERRDVSEEYCKTGKWDSPLVRVAYGDSFLKEIRGNLMIIDSGTGPGVRGLDIFDLEQKKNVYSGSYREYKFSKEYEMEIWTSTNEDKEGKEGCSKEEIKKIEASTLIPVTARKYVLDLKTMKETKTSQVRCDEDN